VIAVTAVCFGPRLTFVVLLAWGAVAAGYVLVSQIAAAAKLATAAKLEQARGMLPAYRGDGRSRTGSAAWSRASCRRCRRCSWACWSPATWPTWAWLTCPAC